MQYIVNVTKRTYRSFPIREHNPPKGEKKDRPNDPNSIDETVTDNANATYMDPITKTTYPADDRQVTQTIPAGTIGNLNALVITSERWYSAALDSLLEDTHSDPRFGTTTYQLSNIGQTPAPSLFMPDATFTQVQSGGFGMGGHHGEGKQPPPPPPPQD